MRLRPAPSVSPSTMLGLYALRSRAHPCPPPCFHPHALSLERPPCPHPSPRLPATITPLTGSVYASAAPCTRSLDSRVHVARSQVPRPEQLFLIVPPSGKLPCPRPRPHIHRSSRAQTGSPAVRLMQRSVSSCLPPLWEHLVPSIEKLSKLFI